MTTTTPLALRHEALQAQADARFGTVLIAHPPGVALLVALAVLAGALVLGLTATGQYTRKAHVGGYLAPTRGMVKVFTPQTATVLERRVSEGQAVKRGEVLMVLSTERSSAGTRDAQAAVLGQLTERRASLRRERGKQGEIDTLTEGALAQRMRGLAAEIEQARGQFDLQQRRVASAERTIQRYQELVAAKFFSELALQQKQDELLDQRNLLASSNRAISGLTRELDGARADLASSALKRANNAALIERQVLELDQQLTEADARRSLVLTASADGTVTTILAEVGQTATPAQPLLSIVPADTGLEAQLLVPTRAAGFIRVGQTVALRYQAFPYQRFGHYQGRIVHVGRTVIQPNESNLPITLAEPVYRVTVALPSQQVRAYGQAMDLQPGMAVDADIWIDRRRIVEWLLDPLLSITGRV